MMGKYVYGLRRGNDPAVTRVRISDQRFEVVASLKGIRQAGLLAGIAFTLDPDDSPAILRDVGDTGNLLARLEGTMKCC